MDKTGDKHFASWSFQIFFLLRKWGHLFLWEEIRSLLPLGRLVLCLGAGSLSGTLSISLVSMRSQVTLTVSCTVGGEKDEQDIQGGVCAVC